MFEAGARQRIDRGRAAPGRGHSRPRLPPIRYALFFRISCWRRPRATLLELPERAAKSCSIEAARRRPCGDAGRRTRRNDSDDRTTQSQLIDSVASSPRINLILATGVAPGERTARSAGIPNNCFALGEYPGSTPARIFKPPRSKSCSRKPSTILEHERKHRRRRRGHRRPSVEGARTFGAYIARMKRPTCSAAICSARGV